MGPGLARTRRTYDPEGPLRALWAAERKLEPTLLHEGGREQLCNLQEPPFHLVADFVGVFVWLVRVARPCLVPSECSSSVLLMRVRPRPAQAPPSEH